MCGIVGYVDKERCVEVLMEGLKHLEYRGYDSAGLALQVSGQGDRSSPHGRIASTQREDLRGYVRSRDDWPVAARVRGYTRRP